MSSDAMPSNSRLAVSLGRLGEQLTTGVFAFEQERIVCVLCGHPVHLIVGEWHHTNPLGPERSALDLEHLITGTERWTDERYERYVNDARQRMEDHMREIWIAAWRKKHIG